MEADLVPGVDLDAGALLGLKHLAGRRGAPGARRLIARPGGVVTRRRGRGSEIDDVRLWTDGDDIRHIDRHATARTGEPHVRTFRDERERAALLVADFRPAMLFGTRRAFRSIAGAEALAILGWRAVQEGGRVGALCLTSGDPVYVRPKGGERAMTAVAGAMAAAHARALAEPDRDDPPLDAALETAAAALPRGGRLALATGLDAPGPQFDDVIRAALDRVSVTVALIADAFEADPPKGALAFLTREGRRGWLAPRGSRGPDPRVERLNALNVPVVTLDAGWAPERAAPELEALDAAR